MSDEICDDMFESTWKAWRSGTHILKPLTVSI